MDSALLLTLLLPVAVVSHVVNLPSKVLFKVGDRRELTCSILSCPETVKFVWTPLEDRPIFATVKPQDKESMLVFDSVMKNHENTILCKATCGKETKQAKTTIKVYSFPTNPVISGHDRLKLGEEATLTCEVSSIHPSEFLEVEWLYGDKVVYSDEGEPDRDAFSFSYTFTPSSEDDGKAITCRVSLNVDAAPHNVKVSGVTAVPLGSSLNLTCEAEGKPKPAFTWTALKPDGQSVEMGKHQVLFVQDVSLSDAGTYQCDVSNDLGSQMASVSVVVQAPPMETLIVASPQTTLKEGDSVSIFCKSTGVPVTHVVLSRRVNGVDAELKSSKGAETSHTIPSVKLADSGTFVCEAFNEYGSQRTTLNLTVEAHLLEVALQPDTEDVLEKGSNLVLSCQASGCPQPEFSWKNLANNPILRQIKTDGFQSQLIFDLVELEDEGTYLCEVTCGSIMKSKQTNLKVFSPPRNTTVDIFPSTDVQEGQNITICCRSVSFPPPAVVLSKLDSEKNVYSLDGVFLLINLTPNDTGLYQINVTNDLGYETETFTINVIEKRVNPPLGWNDFLSLAICLGVASALLGVVVYVWRARKKGSYDLTKCNPSTV
ncbi:vascular cell adhesion 1-like protein [Labeo rohita]|uniref:Vascular cell adhesion 1-like protein n=1 Tax=Labeo rohita TaxID=84645 RepID=A0A498MPA0_LABRO|nr:vascular cell adhesion 1-like protein [Labeo rohita]